MLQHDPADRAFLAYLAARRPEDLGRVFEAVAPRLLHVGRCMGLDESLAQDALQETFLVLIRRGRDFQRERSFLPWATGIYVRQANRARRFPTRNEPLTAEQPLSPAPPELLERDETQRAVRTAMEGLPDTYRDFVRETLLDGAEPRELAERYGLTANAAAVRVHRGIRLLRRVLPPAVATSIFAAHVNAEPLAAAKQHALQGAARAKLAGTISRVAIGALAAAGLAGVLITTIGPAREPAEKPDEVVAHAPSLDTDPAPLLAETTQAEAAEPKANETARIELAANEPLEHEAGREPAGVRGQLVLQNGAPGPEGVEILVLATDRNTGLIPPTGPVPVAATTVADGFFDLPQLDDSESLPLLFATHGHGFAWTSVVDVEDSNLELLLRPGVTASIVLTDRAGTAVEDARVTLLPVYLPFAPFPNGVAAMRGYMETSGYRHLFHERTKADGTVTFPVLPVQEQPTAFLLRAEADGFVSTLHVLGAPGPGAVSDRFELTRTEEILVDGQVEDPLGQPIANVALYADWRGDEPPSTRPLARSDSFGEFWLDGEALSSFPIRLRASAPGYVEALVTWSAPEELPANGLRLLLERAPPVTGVVLDANGDPVPRAIVYCAHASSIEDVQTDEQGRFRFDAVRPGPKELWALPPSSHPQALESSHVALRGTASDARLVLARRPETGRALEVQLVDARTHQPTAPTHASLVPIDVVDIHGPWPESALELDPEGLRVAALPPGRWMLYVAAGMDRLGQAAFDVPAEPSEHSLELFVEVGGSTELEIRLPDPQTPWRQLSAQLVLETAAPGWFELGSESAARQASVLDPSGRTILEDLRPGEWHVWAWSPSDFAEASIDLRTEPTHSLLLPGREAGLLRFDFSAPPNPVRFCVEVAYPGSQGFVERLDTILDVDDAVPRIVPAPPGPISWRVRLLHPLPRIAGGEVYLPLEGEAEVEVGRTVRIPVRFERTRE